MSMQTGKPTTFCFAASQSACKLSPATFPFLLCFLCLYSVCAVKVAFLEVHLNVSSAQAPHRFASETRSLRPSQDRLKLLCIELSDSNFFFVSFSLDLMSCAAAAFSSLQGCHHPHFAYAFKPSPQALPTSHPHKPSPLCICFHSSCLLSFCNISMALTKSVLAMHISTRVSCRDMLTKTLCTAWRRYACVKLRRLCGKWRRMNHGVPGVPQALLAELILAEPLPWEGLHRLA